MSNHMTRRLFLGTISTGLLPDLFAGVPKSQTPGASQTPPTVEKNVVFGKGGETELRCDIYHPPASTAKRMAIVHFHGGGYQGGNKDALADRLKAWTNRGYVNIAAQYRLGGVAKWPSQVEDAKACVRWARANAARLGVDPRRIAVSGYSAGGHLALFVAGTQNRAEFEGTGGNAGAGTELAACCAFYAAANPTVMKTFPLAPGSGDDAWRAATPATYIKSFPPTVLFHGLADVTVAPDSSQEFLRLLRDANIPAELHTFAGVPHEFDRHPEFAEATAQLADFFIDRHVLNPRTYPPFGAGGPKKG
jgi:acetyl esterase/lipase